ncbi:MAG: 30S ribosomal protein S11 [Candidatus Liptonbacteria bacterium]|nr:30S ribosomal protein S11 [Candidatus Liptonbacteria bacterium]
MGKKKVVEKPVESAKGGAAEIQQKTGSKKAQAVGKAKIYINATYNNTMITVTDTKGNVLAWASAGSTGFVGPKKATPFAASKIVSVIAEKIAPHGITEAEIFVKGVGSGRDSALRSFINRGLNVSIIKDKTPIPHNGPRPPKTRRI